MNPNTRHFETEILAQEEEVQAQRPVIAEPVLASSLQTPL